MGMLPNYQIFNFAFNLLKSKYEKTLQIFNIKSDLTISDIKLFNSLGNLIVEKKVNAMDFFIDLNGKASGIYFIQLIDQNDNCKTEKIIVK